MFSLKREIDFTGYTFIVPSVSVGNVPQLAVDAIVETLNLEPIGQLWHPALIPIVGAAAFEHSASEPLTTTAELYLSEQKKLLVLQIRAPLVGSLLGKFLDELAAFVHERKFARVLLPSSCFSHENSNIRTVPFRYVLNSSFSRSSDVVHLLFSDQWVQHTGGVIHGGGFASKLMDKLSGCNVPALILFMYVSEGDNTTDGLMMAQMLHAISGNLLLARNATEFRRPKSWKYLFGSDHPQALY